MKKKKFRNLCLAAVLGIAAFAGVCSYDAGAGTNIHIINVSYDPTRELYESYNKIFKEHWKEKTGQDAEADYVRVDLAGTKTVNGYPARKRKVAIEVAEFTDNDGEITGSGNLLGKGDWEFGFFDTEKKTFKTEAGE